MVDAFCEGSALGTCTLDLLRVRVKRAHLSRVVDLGAVCRGCRPDRQQPFHEPAQVCTRACLVVVHDTAWGKEVVDHVRAERHAKHQAETDLSVARSLASHNEALVSHVDSFLEVAHVLRRRCRAA